MPSLNDFYNELTAVNAKLQALQNDIATLTAETTAVRTAVTSGLSQVDATLDAGFTNMAQGLQALITLDAYANELLLHHASQHDTMICSLEQIARNTCSILNEAHTQTGLQETIKEETTTIAEIGKTAHAAAALDLERREELREQLEECCPPAEPEPACVFEPCEPPRRPPSNPPDVPYKPYEAGRRD